MRIILLFALCLLVSCGPTYKTTYTFVPPKTEQGKRCANQCITQRNNCMNQCNQALAVKDIAGEALNFGQSVVGSKNPNYYSNDNDTDSTDQCTQQCNAGHRICHENCGGQVITNKICTWNCPKNTPQS